MAAVDGQNGERDGHRKEEQAVERHGGMEDFDGHAVGRIPQSKEDVIENQRVPKQPDGDAIEERPPEDRADAAMVLPGASHFETVLLRHDGDETEGDQDGARPREGEQSNGNRDDDQISDVFKFLPANEIIEG